MSLKVPGVPAQDAASQLVFVGPTVYVYLGPSLSALVPGKTWIAATPTQLGSSGSSLSTGISAFEQLIGNPATLVTQLHGGGVRFTSLGASTFDGAPVQGYLVKLPPSESGAAAASPSGTTVAGAHTGERLYVSSKGLVKAIVVPVLVGANGQTLPRVHRHRVLPLRPCRHRRPAAGCAGRHPGAVPGRPRVRAARAARARPHAEPESLTEGRSRRPNTSTAGHPRASPPRSRAR